MARFDPGRLPYTGLTGNKGYSAIAAGPNGSTQYINLVTGKQGTGFTTAPGFIDGALGPAAIWANAVGNISFPTGFSSNIFTAAAICRPTNLGVTNVFVSSDQVGDHGVDFRLSAGVVGATLQAVIVISSGITVTVNQPYFLATSRGPAKTHFVVVNLKTGQLSQATISDSNVALTGAGANSSIGGLSGHSVGFTGYIGAAMISPVFITLPQLLAWATDPWSFWYPRMTAFYVGTAAVATRRLRMLVGAGQ